MSIISHKSQDNNQFYSPAQTDDHFQSAQDKKVTPFDEERSITPQSHRSNHQEQQAFPFDFHQQQWQPQQSQQSQQQFQPEWLSNFPDSSAQTPQQQQQPIPQSSQQTPISAQRQFNFDDFGEYNEDEANDSADVGKASNVELEEHMGIKVEQSEQPRKQSRDILDIEDLMIKSANQSQQSGPFAKMNPEDLIQYVTPDQMPSNPLERQIIMGPSIQTPFSNFPFMETISPYQPKQNLAFTFHDSQQLESQEQPSNPHSNSQIPEFSNSRSQEQPHNKSQQLQQIQEWPEIQPEQQWPSETQSPQPQQVNTQPLHSVSQTQLSRQQSQPESTPQHAKSQQQYIPQAQFQFSMPYDFQEPVIPQQQDKQLYVSQILTPKSSNPSQPRKSGQFDDIWQMNDGQPQQEVLESYDIWPPPEPKVTPKVNAVSYPQLDNRQTFALPEQFVMPKFEYPDFNMSVEEEDRPSISLSQQTPLQQPQQAEQPIEQKIEDPAKTTPRSVTNQTEFFSGKSNIISENLSPQISEQNSIEKAKKKSNPFEGPDEFHNEQHNNDSPDIPWDDIVQTDNKPPKVPAVEQLQPIVEVDEDQSLSQSIQMHNRNSALIGASGNDNTSDLLNLEVSKSFNQSFKPESWEPKYAKGYFKESLDLEQLADTLVPKITNALKQDMMNNGQIQQIEAQLSNISYNLEQKLNYLQQTVSNKDDEFDKNDYVLQKVEMIEQLFEAQNYKIEQIHEQLQKQKQENQVVKDRESKVTQQKSRDYHIPQSPFDMDLSDGDSLDYNNPAHPTPNNVKFVQSNYYSGSPKGFTPVRYANVQQSRYAAESVVEEVKQKEELLKFETNYRFIQTSLKGFEQFDIQSYKKMCISETCQLLDTFELFVSASYDHYEENNQQCLRVIVSYKNKANYDLTNFIVMQNPTRANDKYQVSPNKISEISLKANETMRQEFKFNHYNLNCVYLQCIIRYQINNIQYGIQPIKIGQTYNYTQPFMYGQDYYANNIQVGGFKRSFTFNIGRPANKFFEYNFITADELSEYKMNVQSQPFFLRSLSELVIYHPWLIELDQYTMGSKLLLRLQDREHEIILRVIQQQVKGGNCVIEMNSMDMDTKTIEHLLNFFSFLFQRIY